MCDKAVDTHPSTIQFVPECYKIPKMCYKAVHRFFVFDSIPDQYETQKNVTCFFISSFKSILPC